MLNIKKGWLTCADCLVAEKTKKKQLVSVSLCGIWLTPLFVVVTRPSLKATPRMPNKNTPNDEKLTPNTLAA